VDVDKRVPDPGQGASSAFSLVAVGVQNERERTSQSRKRQYGCAVQILESRGEMAAWPQGAIYCASLRLTENIERSHEKGTFLVCDVTHNYSVQFGP